MSIGGIGDLTGAISSSIDTVSKGVAKAVATGGLSVIPDAIELFGAGAKTAFDQAATMAGAKPNVGAPGFLEQPLEFLGKLVTGKAQDLGRAVSNSELPVNEKLASALGKALEDKAKQIKEQAAKIEKGKADGSIDVFAETEKLKAMSQEFNVLSNAVNEVMKNLGQALQGAARKG
jgi:hypothetical protein